MTRNLEFDYPQLESLKEPGFAKAENQYLLAEIKVKSKLKILLKRPRICMTSDQGYVLYDLWLKDI